MFINRVGFEEKKQVFFVELGHLGDLEPEYEHAHTETPQRKGGGIEDTQAASPVTV